MSEDARKYVDVVLAGVTADLASCGGKGARNPALNRAAFRLGQLIPYWPLDESEAEGALLAAIAPWLDGSMTQREALYHIRRGLREGQLKPQAPKDDSDGRPVGGGQKQRPANDFQRPAIPQAPVTVRPAQNEVLALWDACLPVDAAVDASTWDNDALAWLVSRDIDADMVAADDLARMIPPGADLPPWAMFGQRTWPEAGYGLVVSAWDASGERLSLQARRTVDGKPKTLWPRGCESRGLVFANPLGVAMLQGKAEGAVVVLVEGLPDWLTAACLWPEIAVIGYTGGGWTVAHAGRVPDGATVAIRGHNDEAGQKYTTAIVETFRGRKVTLTASNGGAT